MCYPNFDPAIVFLQSIAPPWRAVFLGLVLVSVLVSLSSTVYFCIRCQRSVGNHEIDESEETEEMEFDIREIHDSDSYKTTRLQESQIQADAKIEQTASNETLKCVRSAKCIKVWSGTTG